MCYNPEISILAWSISIVIAIFLFTRNKNYDRWNAAFIISFCTIQLLEAGLWTNLNNNIINEILTKILLIVLLCQPLVQSFMGYKYTNKELLLYMSIIFSLLLLYGIYRISNNNFSTTIGPNGHLVWNDYNNDKNAFLGPNWVIILYLIGLFIPLLFMREYRGIPLLIIGLATFFYNIKYASTKEFGSMWCFSAIIYSIVAIFV